MAARLLLLTTLSFFHLYSLFGQIKYQTQYAVDMPVEAGPDGYRMTNSLSVFRQQFRLNSKDPKIDKLLVEYFFHTYNGWPGPDGNAMLNFYEGTIDRPGKKIHSQTLNLDVIYRNTGVEVPELTINGRTRMTTITDSLFIEYGKDYIWEIKKPEENDWGYYYTLYKCPGNNWPTNFGDQGVWFKFLGQAISNTDPGFSLVSKNEPQYYVDTFSNQFPYLISNKYQEQEYICKTTHAGKLKYRVPDSTKLLIEKKAVVPGVYEEITMVALDTGLFTVYVVAGEDSISYFDFHATDKKIINCSYTYLKYPGESSHDLLNQFENISTYISNVYAKANVRVEFTDLGIKEYEWDLDGNGSYYDPEYKDIYAAMDQVPNTEYFSNFILMRSNKIDDFIGASNGGGTSQGWGKFDAPPRYAFVASHLFRTPKSLGSTLAHELGHNFGLSHYSAANANFINVPYDSENIMHVGGRKDNLIGMQIRAIHETIDYWKRLGEDYESREEVAILHANDTLLAFSKSYQTLPIRTNSDASVLLKVLNGKEVIEIHENKIKTLSEGVAKIGIFVYATNNYLSAADTLTIEVKKTPPISSFDYSILEDTRQVSFMDLSLNQPTSWFWDFGDGKTSTQQNPIHNYLDPGKYVVRLVTSNAFGLDATEAVVEVGNTASPIASFNYSIIDKSGQIKFIDVSENSPKDWKWDFGDGNNSTEQNPNHKYQTSGEYEVSLVVSNQYGIDTSKQNLNINIGQAPLATFGYSLTEENGKIDFVDQSLNDPISWNWNFGNGNTSSQQNPQHYYLNPGEYTVELIVTNQFGSDTARQNIQIKLGSPPVASFNYSISEQTGQVSMLDQSSNDPTSWLWDFGDGNSSREQNPTHNYLSSGEFTVRLIITNQYGADTTSQNITVKIGQAPMASFGYSVFDQGKQVIFTDYSSNEPLVWLWSFGDGYSSSEQNPVHNYRKAGEYLIRLTVANQFGSDDTTLTIKIIDTQPPIASFDYTLKGKSGQVTFTDQSENKPDSWVWDFGDGATSEQQNPIHQFLDTGTYNVRLIASNQFGTDTTSVPIPIEIGKAPVSSFDFSILETSGEVNFFDLSFNEPTIWEWEFGDGNISKEQNPVHQYEKSGTYTIRLVTANPFGIGSVEKTIDLIVTSINSLPDGAKLFVSPNPFQDILKFSLSNWKSTSAQLRFFTMAGQLQYQTAIVEEVEIDTRDWASGGYVFQLIDNQGILVSGQVIRK